MGSMDSGATIPDDPGSDGQEAGSSTTRRRGAVLADAVVQAAADELLETGYAAMTMDRVAARAGTNKNAIYRRFSNRMELGVAAYGRLTRSAPVPDTGSLRGDILALLTGANEHWTSPLGKVLRELMVAAGGAPDLLEHLDDGGSDQSAAPWMQVLERAVARDEAPSSALRLRVATLPMVMLRNEFVTRGAPSVPAHVLIEIVDDVYLPLIRGYRS